MTVMRATVLLFSLISGLAFVGTGLYAAGEYEIVDGYGVHTGLD